MHGVATNCAQLPHHAIDRRSAHFFGHLVILFVGNAPHVFENKHAWTLLRNGSANLGEDVAGLLVLTNYYLGCQLVLRTTLVSSRVLEVEKQKS